MSMLYYSPAAEKCVARLLDHVATMKLEGMGTNSERFDEHYRNCEKLAMQIMKDNDETTGYSATLAEINAELAADNEVQS